MARAKGGKAKKAKGNRTGKMSRPFAGPLPLINVKFHDRVELPELARLKKEKKKTGPTKDIAEGHKAKTDVDREFLVVMSQGATSKQVSKVIEAARSKQGRVVQRYPPRIIIGQYRNDMAEQLLALDGVSAVYTSPEELRLDRGGLLALRAWVLRHTTEYRSLKAGRRIEGRTLPKEGCQQ